VTRVRELFMQGRVAALPQEAGTKLGPRFSRNLAVFLILAAVYFVAGKLGLRLAFAHPSATAVWPPAGIALAAFLILGYRVWPAILVGAFLVNITTAGSAATSIGIAIGNTLEGLVGAYLINRFAGGRNAFDRPVDIFKFAGLAGMLSTTVSPTFGVTSLSLAGFAPWGHYGNIWVTWWLGDAVGALLWAPLLLLWSTSPRVRWNWRQAFEATILLVCLLVVGYLVFGVWAPAKVNNYPLVFLSVPFLIWAACRFGQREAITAVFALSKMAVWGTLSGLGPFVREGQNESLLFLQMFVGVASLMTLALAAVVSELRKAHNELELQVQQRTQDLSKTVGALQAEVTERKQAENAVRQLSGRLLRSQDEERRRIARDLHDSTGQKVAALAIDLAAVEEEVAALQPRARKALSECLSLSDQISSEVRTLSYLLHPPLLDEMGLAPAIRWYADGIAQRGKLQMDLEMPHKVDRLPRETETALFRIVQESLTNILLHSGSKKAKISIIQDSQEITLEVSDEGHGIPPGTLNHSNGGSRRPGVGIVSMRERMKQLGGRLEVNSDEGGTVVRAVVSLGRDS